MVALASRPGFASTIETPEDVFWITTGVPKPEWSPHTPRFSWERISGSNVLDGSMQETSTVAPICIVEEAVCPEEMVIA
jgi:hypothetical protein